MVPYVRNVAAPFVSALIVLVFGALMYAGVRREGETTALVDHTHSVIETNQSLLTRLIDAETGARGFVITGDSVYLDPYRGAATDVRADLGSLRGLTADNAAQQRRIDTLDGLTRRRLAALDAHIATRARAGFDSARIAFVGEGGGKAMMDSARRLITDIDLEEQRLLAARATAQRAHERADLLVAGGGAAVAALLAMTISFWLSTAAATEARLAGEVRRQADAAERHAAEVDDANSQLQEQAAEMETLNEELTTTNEQLEERTQEAEQANRIKAEFLANMSHDLRTPLNAIVGYVDLLETGVRGPLSEEQAIDVRRIRRSASHLLSLINDVLDFAQVDAGRVRLDIAEVSVEHVLAELDPLVHPQAAAKGLELTTRCEGGLVVRADREKVDQILVNLVGNAIKFTDRGGRIEVDCRSEGSWASIDVRDTGEGIPTEQLESVFEAFVQLSATRRTREASGVGLGLSISRRLARAMGGDLTVRSVLGAGSTFTLRLPRADGTHDGTHEGTQDGTHDGQRERPMRDLAKRV